MDLLVAKWGPIPRCMAYFSTVDVRYRGPIAEYPTEQPRGRFTLNSGLGQRRRQAATCAVNSRPMHRSKPFIRSPEERWRNGEVESSRSLQVHHLVEFDRHLNRQVTADARLHRR